MAEQSRKFMKRLYGPQDLKAQLKAMISHIRDLRSPENEQRIGKKFIERIMMAVTEVNGCRYCSYFHTQVALKEGIEKGEIKNILSGCFDDAPDAEIAALYFAQHYAESGGHPHEEAVTCLEKEYGQPRTNQIMQYIRMIMIGNTWGNAFDALQMRLRGNPEQESTPGKELGVIFGPFWMIPFIILRRLFIQESKDDGTR